MKRRIATWFLFAVVLLLVVLVGCATTETHDKEADLAAWKETSSLYGVAVNTGDVDLYVSLWDENGVRMPPGMPEVVGREAIRAGVAQRFPLYDIRIETDDEEPIYAGDYIIGRCRYITTMTPKKGGEPIVVDGKSLSIWKRQPDGSWAALYDCFNSSVP